MTLPLPTGGQTHRLPPVINLGSAQCSLELSHGQQDGKILNPPVGLHPCKTPWLGGLGVAAWLCAVLPLTTTKGTAAKASHLPLGCEHW